MEFSCSCGWCSLMSKRHAYKKFVTHQSISSPTLAVTNLDSTTHTSLQWIPPPHGSSVKLNCDAAFKNLSAAFGIVARDLTGLLHFALGNRCHAISPLHTEIIAVHSTCSLAFNHGCFNAIINSDSQIAISLSSLNMSSPWSLATLVDGMAFASKTVNNSIFKSFLEKEKLSCLDFFDWYRNLRIVLTAADLLTYLELPIPAAPIPATPGQQIPADDLVAHTRWVKASNEIEFIMLVSMNPELQKNLEHFADLTCFGI
nr:zinc finger, CCHC-type [Tanacetum cinerariifolium]